MTAHPHHPPAPLQRVVPSRAARLGDWLMAAALRLLDGPVRQTRPDPGSRPQAYIHHSALIRRIFNPLSVRGGTDAVLFVRGRTSGKRLAVPMDPPFEWEGVRYLVSPMGNSHWARNLRAAGQGELRIGGRLEQFRAVELQGAERDAIVTAYAATITCACRLYLRRLPHPADHPVFRIDPPSAGRE